MRKKIEHIAIVTSMSIIVAIFLIFMFWWLFPYKTTDNEQPYKILNENKTVKQGDMLLYKMKYCKYTDLVPIVERQFIDGIIYSTPTASAQLQRGCGEITNSVKVPSTLPAGEYYIRAVVTFKVNPIREISKTFLTEKFKVIK